MVKKILTFAKERLNPSKLDWEYRQCVIMALFSIATLSFGTFLGLISILLSVPFVFVSDQDTLLTDIMKELNNEYKKETIRDSKH